MWQIFIKYFCYNLAIIRGDYLSSLISQKLSNICNFLNEHGGVRGEARFPPLDGPQKLPAQFLTNFLPNHIM